jgi:acyl-CoA synthetase (AMP-forming)/AMP-acid ligase II
MASRWLASRWLADRRADAELAMVGLPALLRSGIVGPMGPRTLARIVAAQRRFGTTPATLGAIAAARWPDRPAIIDERGTITYAELDQRATAVAAVAQSLGAGPDGALAVLCRNGRAFVEAMLAAPRIGADVVLLNTELPATTLAKTLPGYRIGAMVCDAEFTAHVEAAGYRGPVITEDTPTPLSATLPRPERQSRIIMLTSGTTGIPKGVPRSPSTRAFAGAGSTVLARMGLRSADPIAVAIPLFHGFGLAVLMLGLFLGSPVVLRRRFDPRVTLADIAAHRVTTLAAVPVMLQRILALPDDVRAADDTTSLRVVLSGAAPLNPVLATAFMDTFGDILHNGYGSSEVGIATIATPADLRAAPGTVGRAVLGAPIRIIGEQGNPLPKGSTGRIFVGGAMTFDGYSTGGTKDVIDGLMSTGDLGHLDEDHRLFVEGREDDMIVSGGENVFPQEVEHVLARHPAVADQAVLGVPDDEFGQRLAAFVVLREPIATPELRAYLKENLARYQQPRDLTVVANIPRNPTGKIDRHGLTALSHPTADN